MQISHRLETISRCPHYAQPIRFPSFRTNYVNVAQNAMGFDRVCRIEIKKIKKKKHEITPELMCLNLQTLYIRLLHESPQSRIIVKDFTSTRKHWLNALWKWLGLTLSINRLIVLWSLSNNKRNENYTMLPECFRWTLSHPSSDAYAKLNTAVCVCTTNLMSTLMQTHHRLLNICYWVRKKWIIFFLFSFAILPAHVQCSCTFSPFFYRLIARFICSFCYYRCSHFRIECKSDRMSAVALLRIQIRECLTCSLSQLLFWVHFIHLCFFFSLRTWNLEPILVIAKVYCISTFLKESDIAWIVRDLVSFNRINCCK